MVPCLALSIKRIELGLPWPGVRIIIMSLGWYLCSESFTERYSSEANVRSFISHDHIKTHKIGYLKLLSLVSMNCHTKVAMSS